MLTSHTSKLGLGRSSAHIPTPFTVTGAPGRVGGTSFAVAKLQMVEEFSWTSQRFFPFRWR